MVTGGRDVRPSTDELSRLASCMRRHGCRVLRVGDCPTGVDASVWAFSIASVLGEPDPADPRGHQAPRRWWSLEHWLADWDGQSRGAGPRRNRAALLGDPSGCAGAKAHNGCLSVGRVNVLVAWPGGAGTKDARDQADGLRIRVVPIANVAA